jgi:hypothetical protein
MRIVTGMHRSGTSVVARLFHEAGADLGPSSTFYPGDRWNPDGYFEQVEVLEANRALLHGPWGRLAYFHLPGETAVLRRGRTLGPRLALVAAAFANRVSKDPRYCITLPAWRAHGARVKGVLACLRHPLAVARSLQRRNRLPLALGFRLWRQHNERLRAAAAGLPLRWVRYEDLLRPDAGPAAVGAALRFLGEPCDDARAASLHAACIKASMDHGGDAGKPLPRAVGALWEELCAATAAQPAAGAAGPAGAGAGARGRR